VNFWHAAKWIGLVLVVLILAMGLASLFAGEEHDRPAGDRAPMTQRVLPWLILGAAVAGLVGAAVLSSRPLATREALARNLRFFGAVSIIATVLAVVLTVALGITLTAGVCCGPFRVSNETLFVLLALFGLVVFLALVGVQAHGTKKVLEAHYDLKRTTALLQEAIERLAELVPKAGAP
jgi:MFS family permease